MSFHFICLLSSQSGSDVQIKFAVREIKFAKQTGAAMDIFTAVINLVSPLLVMWAVRNTFRGLIYLFCVIAVLHVEDMPKLFHVLLGLQFPNLLLAIYQSLVTSGGNPDFVHGLFANGAGANTFSAVLFAYYLNAYLNGREPVWTVAFVAVTSIMIATMAEEKTFFLYFINSVFIALATFIGVKLLHFKQIEFLDKKKERMVYRIIWGIVILTMIPAGIMTYRILQKTYMNSQVNHFVCDHLNWEGTLVLASQVEDDNSITVHLMGPEIDQERIDSAARNLALYPSLKGYKLEVIQGTEYERMRILESKLHSATLMGQEHLLHLEKIQLENEELSNKLESYQKYEQLTLSLHRELRILFPQVKTLSLIPTLETSTDSTATHQYVTAQVFLEKKKMEPQELEKLRLWLKEKAQTDSLRLITDHAR